MKKKKVKMSIFNRVFLPLLFIVFLQVILVYAIFNIYGIFRSLDDNAMGLLEEKTQNKQQSLAVNMLSEWSSLSETAGEINNIVDNTVEKLGLNWQDIKEDSDLNAEIIEDVFPILLSQMRLNRTTGIFFILDGCAVQEDKDTYAGICLRDNDPDTSANDNSDISLMRGLPGISRDNNISLHSLWKAYYKFEGGAQNTDNSYFFNPLVQAQENNTVKGEYLSYWSRPFSLNGDYDEDIITYSLPVISKNGDVYGVLGVEISLAYLETQIIREKYSKLSECMYYLGITCDEGKSYEKVCSVGSRNKVEDIEVLNSSFMKGNEYIILQSEKNDNLIGAVLNLELYKSNTPFIDEQWALIGIQDKDSLFASSVQTKKLMLIAMLIALIIGTIVSIMVGRGIVRPVKLLAKKVGDSDGTEKLKLPVSGIVEIDSLSAAIETMSEEILEAATRTSKLIELSGLPVGVYEIRKDNTFAYCSDGFFELFGCSDIKQGSNYISVEQLKKLLAEYSEKEVEENVYEIKDQNHKKYIRSVKQSDNGDMIGAVLDVTKEIQSKRRIEHERDYDMLTEIWNRRAFERKLRYLFYLGRDELKIAAMVMMDLDNLKYVNDTYGHDSGDDYIRSFAKGLCENAGENAVYARRSGDEFYMFLYGYDSKEQAYGEIRKILKNISSRFIVMPDGALHKLRSSAGVAWYPDDSDQVTELIHYADFAMYKVKHAQKGSMFIFDKDEYVKESFLVNGHEALDRLIDNMLVHFALQPIIVVKTGKVYGYEMLMRSEVEELKTPDVILRMAKSQGKLSHIERITWYKALEEADELTSKGIISENTKLFINTIADQRLKEADENYLHEKYGKVMKRVVIEITEGETNNQEYTKHKIDMVREQGGFSAIDDYGTGYNSELALVMIPAEIVKIDMSLVRNVDKSQDKQMIIRNLIIYARKRNISVLAEGIETSAEMKMLASYGVDYMQGYYFAKPQFTPTEIDPKIVESLLECGK